jgi:hypothetical protein
MPRALPLLVLLAFVAAVFGAGPGNKGYTFQTIDYPAADRLGTEVLGIGSSGIMVGNWFDHNFIYRAFVLRGDQFTSFSIDDNPITELWDVNSQGTAVGDFYDENYNVHGFIYSADGTITHLPDPAPGAVSSPAGINNRGAVTGYYSVDNSVTLHGYIYLDGQFTYFDVPGSSFVVPNRITDSGTVCGYFNDALGNSHGFLRDKKGNLTQFDVPGAISTYANGMNDKGDIVGYYWDGTAIHGFLLRNGAFLPLDYPGSNFTNPQDINNAGVIVGFRDGFPPRGFVATPSH